MYSRGDQRYNKIQAKIYQEKTELFFLLVSFSAPGSQAAFSFSKKKEFEHWTVNQDGKHDHRHLHSMRLDIRHNILHILRILRRPNQKRSSPPMQRRPARMAILQNLHVPRDRHHHSKTFWARLLFYTLRDCFGDFLGPGWCCCGVFCTECWFGPFAGFME